MKPDLPRGYQVLPYSIRFRIPGYESETGPSNYTFAPENLDSSTWYRRFVDAVEAAVGTRFLPVCRLGDGEFKFWLGVQPPSRRLPFIRRLRGWAGWFLQKARGGFVAETRGRYISGHYSASEWRRARGLYEANISYLLRRGVLAMSIAYRAEVSYQERYFPALRRRLEKIGIELTAQNVVPVYFVYALMSGPDRDRVMAGRRLLVVHSATGEKRERIRRRLEELSGSAVLWHHFPENQSMYHEPDLTEYVGKVDLCLVGAGVGKIALLPRLEALQIPCLDIGFIFETWHDPTAKAERPFLIPDSDKLHAVEGERR